jgi:hypothetical protein
VKVEVGWEVDDVEVEVEGRPKAFAISSPDPSSLCVA